jgi:uncharacterized membrane protein YfcA
MAGTGNVRPTPNPSTLTLNDAATEAIRRPWWRRPSIWLAWLEIAIGLSVGFGGCLASLATDESLAGVGAVYVFLVGVMTIAVPGALLLGRSPRRWLGQILPAALVVLALLAWHGDRITGWAK